MSVLNLQRGHCKIVKGGLLSQEFFLEQLCLREESNRQLITKSGKEKSTANLAGVKAAMRLGILKLPGGGSMRESERSCRRNRSHQSWRGKKAL